MAADGTDHLRQDSWPPVNPWNVVLAGLAVAFLALLLNMLQGWLPGDGPARVLIPLRGLAIAASLILAGGAVRLRLRTASWEFGERGVSAALTGLAALT